MIWPTLGLWNNLKPAPIMTEYQVIKRKSWQGNHRNPFILQMNKLRLTGAQAEQGVGVSWPALGFPSVHLLVLRPWPCPSVVLDPCILMRKMVKPYLLHRVKGTRNTSCEVLSRGPGLEEEHDTRQWKQLARGHTHSLAMAEPGLVLESSTPYLC